MSELHSQVPPLAVIDTERLQLKTLVMEDLDDVMDIISDLRVMKWSSKPPMTSKEQGAVWLSARCLGPDCYNFAIRENRKFKFALREKNTVEAASKIVGIMGCSQELGVLGYLMNTDYAGRGYATEALKAFIPAFFAWARPASEGGTDVLSAYIDTQNGASRRVLEKSGFQNCELLHDQHVHVQDNPHNHMKDSYLFRIARPGKTLEQLGFLGGEKQDIPPEPPVQ